MKTLSKPEPKHANNTVFGTEAEKMKDEGFAKMEKLDVPHQTNMYATTHRNWKSTLPRTADPSGGNVQTHTVRFKK